MKKSNPLNSLVKELNRDPRLKGIVAKVKRRSRKNGVAKVENLADFFLLSLAIVSRFVSKKKARALDELMDVVYLLVQVSMLLKENVFDRPEVREFLSQRSKRVFSVARQYVDVVLSRTHEVKDLKLKKAS